MRAPIRSYFSLGLLFAAALSAPAARADDTYLSELVARAREARLADDRQWLVLGLYRDRLVLPGVRSLGDDPTFFLAEDGKTNPAAELEATLAAFFDPPPEEPAAAPEGPGPFIAGAHTQSAQCRYRARYEWLREKLEFDPSRLPEHRCHRFEEWLDALAPAGLTVVFPAAYMNNPASMFGHTLLRIDGRGQDESTRLLAYSANYAASTGQDGGAAFALKGLLGGYYGSFSVSPYYERVKDYSDLENRDIWEYRLDITPDETRRALAFLWELGHTYFTYYFFDENCSYYLLPLLEHARDGTDISSRFTWYAIPSDVMGEIAREPGLIDEVTFRPALGTTLRRRLSELSGEDRRLVGGLVEGSLDPSDSMLAERPVRSQMAVLEAAAEFANFQVLKSRKPPPGLASRARELMAARSRLGPAAAPLQIPTPKIRPDEGHAVARAAVGAGREEDRWFYDLKLRPAYHDLLDPEGGYVRGGQINFFSLEFRHYEHDELELTRFLPVEIVSIAPRDEFFKPVSWRVRTGIERRRLDGGLGTYAFVAHGGPGLAYEPHRSLLLYGFLDGALEYSPRYSDENYAAGAGPGVGLLLDLTDRWRTSLTASVLRLGTGREYTSSALTLEQSYTISPSLSLRLELSRRGERNEYWNGVLVSAHHYF